jgi:hypothetical protein
MGNNFKINKINGAFEIQEKALPLNQSDLYKKDSNYLLYITKEAKKKLYEYINWGEFNDNNKKEQGGILIGTVFQDTQKGIVYGIVKDIIIADTNKRSGTSLVMDISTWKKMLEEFNAIHNNSLIIGWFHTHPNNLAVFMSQVDNKTQQLFFYNDWHFSLVLNPHKKIWKVFHGKNSEECNGFFSDLDYDKNYQIVTEQDNHNDAVSNVIITNNDKYVDIYKENLTRIKKLFVDKHLIQKTELDDNHIYGGFLLGVLLDDNKYIVKDISFENISEKYEMTWNKYLNFENFQKSVNLWKEMYLLLIKKIEGTDYFILGRYLNSSSLDGKITQIDIKINELLFKNKFMLIFKNNFSNCKAFYNNFTEYQVCML